jgi:hypothetical protein
MRIRPCEVRALGIALVGDRDLAGLGFCLSLAFLVSDGNLAGESVWLVDAFQTRALDDGSGAFEAGAEAVAGYVEGTWVMFSVPILGGPLNWPLNGLGVPPCWRAFFLLLRQKKEAKEKATPRSAPLRGSLRYSAHRAACLNSPAAQTRQADDPRSACVAQRLSRGPEKRQSEVLFSSSPVTCNFERGALEQ